MSRVNAWVKEKAEILSQFEDVGGDCDTEVGQAAQEAKQQVETIDAEIVMWGILAEARRRAQGREDEV